MHVSSDLPHMLVSNHRGRGQEPVTVLGRMTSFVTVKAMRPSHGDPTPSSTSTLMLASCHWPGNVRELENALERAS